MEVQTSNEAYEIYRKLKDREFRVERYNRGLTLLNANEFKSSFFISVLKEVDLNILEKEERVVVETNVLPYDFTSYSEDLTIQLFLKKLKDYMSTPKYELFVKHNRRMENKVDMSWDTKFREKDFDFEDLEITIGEQAKSYVDSLDFNFVEEIKKIIKNKRQVTDKEITDFERYSLLYNRIKDLKRQFEKPHSNYYSYGEPNDSTLKITIGYEEYNEKLKEVETEMKKICKKYCFLKLPRFDYVEIKEPVSLEDWKKEHGDELRENWDELDDSEKEEWDGNFDSYAEYCFEEYEEED